MLNLCKPGHNDRLPLNGKANTRFPYWGDGPAYKVYKENKPLNKEYKHQ